jgi:GNAT superfamily N-acetyltransferase
MEVRAVRRSEALEVARVHVQADAEVYAAIFGDRFRPVALDASLARWELALTAGDVFLVATDGAAPVGLAHAHEDWMSALYLLASHRRRGIGRRLLGALCEGVRARGVLEIRFQCVAANVSALAFYEAMGARAVGHRREGGDDDGWDDVVFALATDAPAASRRG